MSNLMVVFYVLFILVMSNRYSQLECSSELAQDVLAYIRGHQCGGACLSYLILGEEGNYKRSEDVVKRNLICKNKNKF